MSSGKEMVTMNGCTKCKCLTCECSGKAFPPRLWFKDSGLIGAEVLRKSGLHSLIKARAEFKEGYQEYVHSALMQAKDKEIERLRAALDISNSFIKFVDISKQDWPIEAESKKYVQDVIREALAGGEDES